jgi:hypothetical protein
MSNTEKIDDKVLALAQHLQHELGLNDDEILIETYPKHVSFFSFGGRDYLVLLGRQIEQLGVSKIDGQYNEEVINGTTYYIYDVGVKR